MPKVGMEPIRRSQIINSTLECICIEGIEKMSLDMVAKEAKCSKGVISYYYKSKDNLILESFRAFLNYYKIKIDSEIRKNMTPYEMLRVVQENALPKYYNMNNEPEPKLNVSELDGVKLMNIPPAKKAKLFVNFFSRAMIDTNLQEALQEVYKEDYSGISSIISHGTKAEIFKETDINKSAYAIMALYIGISMLRVVGFKPEQINDDIDVFWNVMNSMFVK
ncbi:TetR family transcriptional regulator [Clostridium aciditolerans]|uniref:TetR family transcriptional regulator n=1 Tax=Clostridium aciditolerans TaxID=339861 RepID=A0A934I3K6_9CLOT|nr:TetR/AcrR family transcriptional regulator [Clostridium aciditolerans]MBI6875648.1 TetR family transcriptional regulator [Clostridium aciditolerans]